MRILNILVLVLLATAALAGCSEKATPSDDHDHADHNHGDECPDVGVGDQLPDGSGDGNDTLVDNATADVNTTTSSIFFQPGNETGGSEMSNTTMDNETMEDETESAEGDCPDEGSEGPNQLPIAALSMTLEDGTALNETTAIMAGTTVFFSAEGSMDPDGTIDLIGLTVKDTNSTRIAPNLLADGVFQTVNFTFDHEGAINITLRVLDNQGDATVLDTFTFVNRVQNVNGQINLPGGASAGDAAACKSPSDQGGQGTLPGQQTGAKLQFQVAKGAKWIEAKLVGGSGEIAICDPSGSALSGSSTSSVSTEEGELEPAIDYYVMVLSGTTPAASYSVDVIVHHEPKA